MLFPWLHHLYPLIPTSTVSPCNPISLFVHTSAAHLANHNILRCHQGVIYQNVEQKHLRNTLGLIFSPGSS